MRGHEGSHLRTDVERESERQVGTTESSGADRNLNRKCKEKRDIAWRARFPRMQMDVKVDCWSLKCKTIVRR